MQINDYVAYSSQINIMRNFFEKEDDLNREESEYKPNLNKAPRIEFINVSFKYGEDGDYVLKNFNFKIAPGEKNSSCGSKWCREDHYCVFTYEIIKTNRGRNISRWSISR